MVLGCCGWKFSSEMKFLRYGSFIELELLFFLLVGLEGGGLMD